MTTEELQILISVKMESAMKQLKSFKKMVGSSFDGFEDGSKDASDLNKNVSKEAKNMGKNFSDSVKTMNKVVNKEMNHLKTNTEKVAKDINKSLKGSLNFKGNVDIDAKSAINKAKTIGSTSTTQQSTSGSNMQMAGAGVSMLASGKMASSAAEMGVQVKGMVTVIKNLEGIFKSVNEQIGIMVATLEKTSKINMTTSLRNYAKYVSTCKTQTENLYEKLQALNKRASTISIGTEGMDDNLNFDISQKEALELANDLKIAQNTLKNIDNMFDKNLFEDIDTESLDMMREQLRQVTNSFLDIVPLSEDLKKSIAGLVIKDDYSTVFRQMKTILEDVSLQAKKTADDLTNVVDKSSGISIEDKQMKQPMGQYRMPEWGNFKTDVSSNVKSAMESATTEIEKAKVKVSSAMNTIKSSIKDGFYGAMNFLTIPTQNVDSGLNAIKTKMSQGFSLVVQGARSKLSQLKDIINNSINASPNFTNLINKTKEGTNKVVAITKTLKTKIEATFNSIKSSRFGGFMNNIASTVVKGGNKIVSATKKMKEKFNKQMDGMSTSIKDTGSKVKAGLGKIAIIIAAVAAAFKALKGIWKVTQEAIQLEGQMTNLSKTLGNSTAIFNKWANESAMAFGISKSAAVQYGNTFSMLISGFEKDTKKMTDMTSGLLEQAAVIAAGTGRTMDDVLERIRSGMLGNTESIEDIGINVNVNSIEGTDAFKKYANGQSWANLNTQMQKQILYYSIMEQSVKRFGKANEDSLNSSSGVLLKFQAQLENTKLALGNAFKPIVTIVLPLITDLLSMIERALQKIGAFSTALAQMFGYSIDSKSTSGAVEAFDNMGESATSSADAVEKANKRVTMSLSGIDEINNIKSTSEDSTTSPSMNSNVSYDPATNVGDSDSGQIDKAMAKLGKFKELITDISKLFKKGWDIGLGDSNLDGIVGNVKELKKVLLEIVSDPKITGGLGKLFATTSQSLGTMLGSLASVGVTIGENLTGGLLKYFENNKQFIQDKFVGIFEVKTRIAETVGTAFETIADVFTVFKNEDGIKITSGIIEIFSNSALAVYELMSTFGADIIDLIVQPFVDNKDAIKVALENILAPIAKITESVATAVTKMWLKIKEVYDSNIAPLIESLKTGLSELLGTFLDGWNTHIAPVLDALADKFKLLMENHISPFIDKVLNFIGKVADLLKALWENILQPLINWLIEVLMPIIAPALETIGKVLMDVFAIITDVFGGLFDALGGLLDFLTGVFTGDWEKAWNGIKDFFGGIVDGIIGLIGGILTALWDIVSGVFDIGVNIVKGLWDGIVSVWDWIVGKIKGFFSGIVNVVKGIFGIKSPSTIFADIGGNLVKGLWEGVKKLGSWLTTKVGGFFGGVGKTVKGAFNKVGDIGKNVVTGFTDGVQSMASTAKKKVKGFFGGVGDWAKDTLGIHSPSKLFEEFGIYSILGFNKGMDGKSGMLSDNVKDTFNGIADIVKGAFSDVASVTSDSLGNVKTSIGSVSDLFNGVNGLTATINGPADLSSLVKSGVVNSASIFNSSRNNKPSMMSSDGDSANWLELVSSKIASTLVNASTMLGTGNTSDRPLELILQVGTTEFGRVAIESINKLQKQEGKIKIEV